MARIKTVFSSNEQVSHIWAQQTQASGRANNVFFEADKIYSYGYHYLAAQIHTIKGKRIALVRSDAYSPSTGKHLSCIRSALNGLMEYYYVPGSKIVSSPKAASEYLDSRARDSITDAMKRISVKDKSSIGYSLECINDTFKDANNLRKLLGKKPIKPSQKQLSEVKAHLEFRLKRYHELNTPEMIAKRKVEAEKRAERKARKVVAAAADRIEQFRRGEVTGVSNLPYELLRIQGNEVVTSRGARVPLDLAVTLYRAIEAGKNVIGATIGHFTVNSINEIENDKVIVIGCHRILLSEARALLAMKVAA